MDTANPSNSGYSANVQMHLHVNGHTLAIGQLGPDFIMLDDPVDHPPTNAEIILSIDGRIKSWPIQLPLGMTANKPETPITSLPAAANGSTVVWPW